jgi:hypothetical protein
MRLIRPAVVLAAGATLVLLTLPSDAAPRYPSRTLSYADARGDANALNGQGLVDIFTDAFPDNVAGPAQPMNGFDLVKVTYTSTGVVVKRGTRYFPQCTGFVVKLTLGGAPQRSNAVYRVLATTPDNDALWWLEYSDGESRLRYGHLDNNEPTGSTDENVPLLVPAKLSANSITFTVTVNDAKASGEKLTSLRMSGLSSEVRSIVGNSDVGTTLTVPKWDGTAVTSGPFKPC